MLADWIHALKSSIIAQLPHPEDVNPVTIEKYPRHEVVVIAGRPRYIVKKGEIFSCDHNGKIRTKQCYGKVESWDDWDWSGYYPFRKSLYDWQKLKTKKKRERKAPRNMTPEETKKIVNMINSGITIQQVSKVMNVGYKTVWNELKKEGINTKTCERKKKIIELLAQGNESMQAIGEHVGVTRQRISMVYRQEKEKHELPERKKTNRY